MGQGAESGLQPRARKKRRPPVQQPTGTEERCTDHGSGEADPSQASLDATAVSADALPAISETDAEASARLCPGPGVT